MNFNILIAFVFAVLSCGDSLNVAKLSQAIAKMIDNLSDSHAMMFDIVVGSENEQLKLLANRISMNSANPVKIKKYADNETFPLYLGTPSVVLIEQKKNNSSKFSVVPRAPLEFKGSFSDSFKRTTNSYVPTAWIFYIIDREFSYFEHECISCFQIFHSRKNKNELVLVSYLYLTPTSCVSSWQRVNTFSMDTMTWHSNKFIQTYDKFYNCKIGVYSQETKNEAFNGIFTYKKKKNGKIIKGGIFDEVLKIFSETYEAEIVDSEDISQCQILLLQMTDIFISARGFSYTHITSPICFVHSIFLISPGHELTYFEKLVKPFDVFTWIALAITFFVAFITIFIIYRFPQNVQNYVFGQSVNFPVIGSLQIFFGIGYVHLPERNFGRILFMTFTIYCLIVRTGYQGKMFDFMVSTIRHPVPRTVTELFESDIDIASDVHGNRDIM